MPSPNTLQVGEFLKTSFDQNVIDAILYHCRAVCPAVEVINPSECFMPSDEIQDSGTAYFSAVASEPIKIYQGPMPKNFYGIEIKYQIAFLDKDHTEIDRALCDEKTKVEGVYFTAQTSDYLEICAGGNVEFDIFLWYDLFRANIMNRFIDDGRTHKSDFRCAFPYKTVNRDFPIY